MAAEGGPRLEDFYAAERCEECGMCLFRCPTLDLTMGEAREELRRLRRGEPTPFIDGRCASCFSCDTWCPNRCGPYGLILYRWYERYRREGLPVRALPAMPLGEGNTTDMAMRHHTPRERDMVEQWRRNAREPGRVAERGGTALYAGCNAIMFPSLLDTSLLEGLAVLGEKELCCGEVYFRLGLLDVVERQARVLEERFRQLGVRRMVVFCSAGYNMLSRVLPDRFGARFDFEVKYLGDYLLEKVERGVVELGRLDPLRVAVSDTCHAKVLGRDFLEIPRRLLAAMGLEVAEMPHSREYSVCCGAACGARNCNPLDMGRQALAQWEEARRSGAVALVAYCATCLLLLHVGRTLRPRRMPLFHLMELLMRSVGEEPPHRLVAQRSRRVLAGALTAGAPLMLSRRRVRL